jgi:hypothetical protein
MYPLHLAGALSRAEDPRETLNRAHLLALREVTDAERELIEPVRPSARIERIAFAGGSTSLSADFGAATCA